MTLLLIILAAWALALLLVAALCTMARLGDAAQARWESAIAREDSQPELAVGLALPEPAGGAPSQALAAHAQRGLAAARVPADIAA